MSKPTVKQLSNGISVLLQPQKGATSMTIYVYAKVGSRYERSEINGASHFIEHLMFKGTKRRPNTQILSQEIDQYGANYNAMTSKDYTGYYIKMDASKSAIAIDLLHDMLFHSKYDSKEIERERGVIIEELNMYEDNPQMHIDDLLERALFPNSTLGWDIGGPKDVIRKISREELIAYRDAYYIPERLVIAIAGKIPSNVMVLLEKTFGKVSSKKKRADVAFTPFLAPDSLDKPLQYQEKKTEQTQVGIAFYGYPWGHADEPAAKLLALILGGTMSSRLFIEVRERKGLCYSVQASHQPLEDIGVFGIYAGLDKKRLEDAIRTIMKELRSVMKKGVTEKELSMAKDHIRGKLALAFEDSSFQASWFGQRYLFLGDTQAPASRMKELDRVTVGDVKRVAQAMFKGNCMARAVIGDHGKASSLETIFDL